MTISPTRSFNIVLLTLVSSLSLGLGQRIEASEPQVLPLWSDSELGIDETISSATHHDRGSNNSWLTDVIRPSLTLYHPDADSNNGSALVICPGGGYGGLAVDKEGHEVAKWFTEQGGTACVLTYRCGGGANQHPIPIQDGRRAIELVRANASDWGIASDRVGVIGFSAGGHLASTIATDPEAAVNFAALIYPVISMRDDVTHSGSRKNLLGKEPEAKLIAEMSRDEQVTNATCPVFLVHSGDDGAVPVENSLRFYRQCIEHGIDAEMHLFPSGGHGFGMYRGDRPVDQWPDQMKAWMIERGLIAAH